MNKDEWSRKLNNVMKMNSQMCLYCFFFLSEWRRCGYLLVLFLMNARSRVQFHLISAHYPIFFFIHLCLFIENDISFCHSNFSSLVILLHSSSQFVFIIHYSVSDSWFHIEYLFSGSELWKYIVICLNNRRSTAERWLKHIFKWHASEKPFNKLLENYIQMPEKIIVGALQLWVASAAAAW